MEKWVCVYCNHPIPYNARYCSNCSAKIPSLKQSFMEEAAKRKEEEEEKESAPIIKPGDMTGGLSLMVNRTLSGELTPEEFGTGLEEIMAGVDETFEGIYHEISSIETELEDYQEQILSLLENVHFMLTKGVEEMSLFTEDGDRNHLRFGQMLAQRGELEYIQIVELIRHDATASINPFQSSSDIIGELAKRFFDGEINLITFKEETVRFEKTAKQEMEKASKLLEQGFKKAKGFDGRDKKAIYQSLDLLKSAGDLLAILIINLHTREQLEKTMQEMIDNKQG